MRKGLPPLKEPECISRATAGAAYLKFSFWGLSLSKQTFPPLKLRPKLHAVHKITNVRYPIDTAVMRHARLKRRVKAWSWSLNDFMAASLNSRVRMVMITLTYRPGVEWEPQHMNVFMRHVRKSNGIGLLGYAWVAELQQRGAVHFHLLLLVTRGSVIPMPDRCGWWPHGLTRIETARSHWYIVKYAQKSLFQNGGEWKKYPKGIRIFHVWIAPDVISDAARWEFRLSVHPGWLRDLLQNVFPLAQWERPVFGGWRIWPDDHSPPFWVSTPYWIDGLRWA